MSRLGHAWRAMEPEQRLAAAAAIGLFVSMFLPWYSQTDTVVIGSTVKATQTSLSAFEAFSFVEAAVLLVSAGVLVMLFARAERHSFQLPGGDGMITMIAGGWTALLIFYRLLDKPGLHGTERITATVGVQWGIFVALLLALGLSYAGHRMRATERPEPPARRRGGQRAQPRPVEHLIPTTPVAEEEMTITAPAPTRPPRPSPVPAEPRVASSRPRYPPAPSGQMSFEDPPPASDQPESPVKPV